ncbi:hypothetical protein BST61_g8733 [Cercospora zeina]
MQFRLFALAVLPLALAHPVDSGDLSPVSFCQCYIRSGPAAASETEGLCPWFGGEFTDRKNSEGYDVPWCRNTGTKDLAQFAAACRQLGTAGATCCDAKMNWNDCPSDGDIGGS